MPLQSRCLFMLFGSVVTRALNSFALSNRAAKRKNGIIVPKNRNDKVIPQSKPERYNIIEVNDNAD